MTRDFLINEILRLQGKDANLEWLQTRTDQQLYNTWERWKALSGLTSAEIYRHCNTDFLNDKKGK